MKSHIILASLGITLGVASGKAAAISLPDSGSCSGTPCLHISTTGSGTVFDGALRGSGNGNIGGVLGVGSSGPGVRGASVSQYGVWGQASNTGSVGVKGDNSNGIGVEGVSTSNDGIHAVAFSASRSGIFAQNLTSGGGGFGVFGHASGNGHGVHGLNSDSAGWAGFFDGKLFASSGFKPGGGSWSDSSDLRLKKDVKPIDGALERLMRLRGVTFEWIDPKSHGNLVGRQTGMIAQDVEKVFPEWVGTDSKGFRTLTFRGFEALSVEAMRTLAKENEGLRAKVDEQEARISRLEQRPLVSSMLSGGMNVTVALGAAGALVFAVIRRRRERQEGGGRGAQA